MRCSITFSGTEARTTGWYVPGSPFLPSGGCFLSSSPQALPYLHSFPKRTVNHLIMVFTSSLRALGWIMSGPLDLWMSNLLVWVFSNPILLNHEKVFLTTFLYPGVLGPRFIMTDYCRKDVWTNPEGTFSNKASFFLSSFLSLFNPLSHIHIPNHYFAPKWILDTVVFELQDINTTH